MPGQMYINDDTSVPSTNVTIQNNCDISAKETSTSVINPITQVCNLLQWALIFSFSPYDSGCLIEIWLIDDNLSAV